VGGVEFQLWNLDLDSALSSVDIPEENTTFAIEMTFSGLTNTEAALETIVANGYVEVIGAKTPAYHGIVAMTTEETDGQKGFTPKAILLSSTPPGTSEDGLSITLVYDGVSYPIR
jgi:hypothetical protein